MATTVDVVKRAKMGVVSKELVLMCPNHMCGIYQPSSNYVKHSAQARVQASVEGTDKTIHWSSE